MVASLNWASDPLDATAAGANEGVTGPVDPPLLAPVTPTMSWASVHELSQTPLRPGPDAAREPVTIIRRTATIQCGTRMIKPLSARQLGGYLHGRRPSGFCYRAVDVAALRGPAELAMLTGDARPPDRSEVVFALRWRAVDASDYAIPFGAAVGDEAPYDGLTAISPHDRLGPPVLGTGFAPSQHHILPEFVTHDLADLPLPAGASLVAFGPDGIEVSLYLHLPEQRAWTRMFGPQWRHLLAAVPAVAVEQEYVQMAENRTGGPSLVGAFRGEVYEAIADPPHEYRVRSRVRAARYPVEALARRTTYVTWRGVPCTLAWSEGDWARLRLVRPDRDTVTLPGVTCLERGVYEVWARADDVHDAREVDVPYQL